MPSAGEGFAGPQGANVSNGFMPIFGAIETPSAPDNDQWLNTGFGYRNYADATRRHWGADIDLQYYVNTKLSYYANLLGLTETGGQLEMMICHLQLV